MKKQLSSLIAVVSMLIALNVSATVQLVPTATTVNLYDSFTVNVQASALTNIDSASLKFSYNQSVVRLDGITLDGGAAFCDLVVRDTDATDGLVDGIFALAHMPAGEPPAGEPCAALSGDFVAFQIQMTALVEGVALLSLTQDSVGFGWASEDDPGVAVDPITTTVTPVQITVTGPVGIDTDTDGVIDSLDNCTLRANPDQRDTDMDGYGNMCDADFNNDGAVNFADLAYMKSVFYTTDPDGDINGDGAVNFADLAALKSMFFQVPGPSALVQ